MECLQIKLKEKINNDYVVNENTLRIKILKSQGNACKLGIQKAYDSNINILLKGIGNFTNGLKTYELSNDYTYIDVDMSSIIDDNSEIHISNMNNIITLYITQPTLEIVDMQDLKYLNANMQSIGVYNEQKYLNLDDILLKYNNLKDLSIKGKSTLLSSDNVDHLHNLEKLIIQSKEVTGNINKLGLTEKIKHIQVLESNLYGDISKLPSGLTRIESINKGEYGGSFSWKERTSINKRFGVWRIYLGDDLDKMLVDMAACEINPNMTYGYKVYGNHTMEESIWRNAAKILADTTNLEVFINDEAFHNI